MARPPVPPQSSIAIEPYYPKSGAGNGLKALVVDDDPAVCRFLCRHLQEKGFAAFQLLQGAQALRAVELKKPDIVVLDAVLEGGCDGFDLCRRIKAQEQTRDLTVIMISGQFVSRADEDKARRLGASAYLAKPVARNSFSDAVAAAVAQIEGASGAKPRRLLGNILVVEDDPGWLDLIVRWLTEAGHRVVARPNVSDIAETAVKEAVDCIILDFDLDGQHADSVCAQLREKPELNPVPIIAHTAYPDAKLRMIADGADQFAEKLTDPQDLLATIESCLRRKKWDSGAVVHEDLRLEPATRRVHWNWSETKLTEEQFEFLRLLVARAKQWVSSDKLALELGRGKKLSEKAFIQLAVRLRKALPNPLGHRLRYSKRLGWIYQPGPA